MTVDQERVFRKLDDLPEDVAKDVVCMWLAEHDMNMNLICERVDEITEAKD